jgi:AmmeMemoRadiSam system protein B
MRKLIIFACIFLLAFACNNSRQKQAVKNINSAEAEIFHNTYFTQKDFYQQAYERAAKKNNTEYNPNIRAIIVNHHLLAGDFIAESFNKIATTLPVTVLLLSPNHFDAGNGEIITSKANWITPYGKLLPNNELINELVKSNLVSVEEKPFEQEHGISGIIAFVKKSLPNANVVPLIFKNKIKLNSALKFAQSYQNIVALPNQAKTILVGSFDFSHNLTSNAADFHDLKSLSTIENFDFSSIYNLDIDSRPGLAFFLEFLKLQGSQKFTLLENSNSAKLIHKDTLETTSYITGYYEPGQPANSVAQTILSLGNISLASEAVSWLDKSNKAYALTNLERLFFGQDQVVAFMTNAKADEGAAKLNKLGINLVDGKNEILKKLGNKTIQIINCAGLPVFSIKAQINETADIVICQGANSSYLENYKNKLIIYSAGNFLSGQNSLAVGIALVGEQLEVFLMPIGFVSGQLNLLVGRESDKILVNIANSSLLGQKTKEQIKQGILKIVNSRLMSK